MILENPVERIILGLAWMVKPWSGRRAGHPHEYEARPGKFLAPGLPCRAALRLQKPFFKVGGASRWTWMSVMALPPGPWPGP